MTTRGDLLTMATGTTVGRIAIGAADTVLTSDGTDAAWSAVSVTEESDQFVLSGQIFG